MLSDLSDESNIKIVSAWGKNDNDDDDDNDDHHHDDEFSLALYETSIRSSDVIKIMKNNSWIITKIQYLERKSPLSPGFLPERHLHTPVSVLPTHRMASSGARGMNSPQEAARGNERVRV